MIRSQDEMESPLRNRIKSAKTLEDLKSIHQQIDFDQIKQFTLGCLDQFSPKQINKSFYSLPIGQIIPDDVIRRMLSFAPYCARATSKRMNVLGIESERIRMKKLYEPYKQNKEQNTPTVILHPKRTHLNEVEKEYGFKGIYNDVSIAIWKNFRNNGGRILAHNGVHHVIKADCNQDSVYIEEDLQIIGIEPPVVFREREVRPSTARSMFGLSVTETDGKVAVHLENLIFEGATCGCILIIEDADVTINKCTFVMHHHIDGIWLGTRQSRAQRFTMDNCYFGANPAYEGRGDHDQAALRVSGSFNMHSPNDLSVSRCDFQNIQMGIWIDRCYMDEEYAKLKFVNNVWNNLYSSSVLMRVYELPDENQIDANDMEDVMARQPGFENISLMSNKFKEGDRHEKNDANKMVMMQYFGDDIFDSRF